MVDPVHCSLSSCNLAHLLLSFEHNKRRKEYNSPMENAGKFAVERGFDPATCGEEELKIRVEEMKGLRKTRKRPSRLFIPEPCSSSAAAVSAFAVDSGGGGGGGSGGDRESIEVIKGSGYSLACRRGHNKAVMEDGFGVIPNINGNPKQALFAVFDGHGGRDAVDFVSEKLGENILSALVDPNREGDQVDLAMKAGYLTTNKEFISKGVRSGACASTVVLKDGELHVANVGDCRVVLCSQGAARPLTTDHHPGLPLERQRIENSGGYVTCRNGVWRVQDSLAVSRSIGDANMKDWVIADPQTCKVRLTPHCEFLVIASDGLWDKVTNEEAVGVVLKQSTESVKACRELVELACRRGSRDDITVMVVDLQHLCSSSIN